MKFSEYRLDKKISKALDECGYVEPTEVQRLAIPRLLSGVDLVVSSKTGSGKTAAFLLPIMQKILNDDKKTNNKIGKACPQVFIISPTRELSIQIYEDFIQFSKYTNIKGICVYGQHSIEREKRELRKNPQIVCATPGRLIDHIVSGNIDCRNVGYLVLDEADKMLEMGFIDQIKKIIDNIPKSRQTMLFSATMPYEIQKIGSRYMKQPEKIVIKSKTKTVEFIEQSYIEVNRNRKYKALYNILVHERPNSVVIFCNTRNMVDRLAQLLNVRKFRVSKLHGGISQGTRTKTIESFKNHKFKILIATDVAARGIHVDDLSMVINYDLPEDKDNYIHRIGRTGRAGKQGKSISFVSSGDMFAFYEIEEHVGVRIPKIELPDRNLVNKFVPEARKLYGYLEQDKKSDNKKKKSTKKKRTFNKRKSEDRKISTRKTESRKSSSRQTKNRSGNDNSNFVNSKKSNLDKKVPRDKYNNLDNTSRNKIQKETRSDSHGESSNFVKISVDKRNEIIENYKKNKKESKKQKGFGRWLSRLIGK